MDFDLAVITGRFQFRIQLQASQCARPVEVVQPGPHVFALAFEDVQDGPEHLCVVMALEKGAEAVGIALLHQPAHFAYVRRVLKPVLVFAVPGAHGGSEAGRIERHQAPYKIQPRLLRAAALNFQSRCHGVPNRFGLYYREACFARPLDWRVGAAPFFWARTTPLGDVMNLIRSATCGAIASILLLPAAGFLAPKASAQVAALEEIVVTARKREESIQDVPLSITAFTGEELERGGFVDLEDISFQTTGMQFNNELAGTRPGRLFSNIRFRGVEGSEYSTLQTASLFVDGIFALQGAQTLALSDLERVEVIKGPQSAAFGRNSFAGAINYITRAPDMEEFSGRIKVDAGQYDQHELDITADIPIAPGVLALRVGGRYFNKGDMYQNYAGVGVGEQRSESAFATLFVQAADNVSIKLRYYQQEDSDGPAGVTFYKARLDDSCTGKTMPGLTTDGQPTTLMPREYLCGTIPGPGGQISFPNPSVSLSPASFPAGSENFIRDSLIDAPSQVEGVPYIDHFGIEREITRISLVLDYELANGMTLVATGAYNENNAANLRDWDMTPDEAWYVSNPQAGEDESIDIRLSSAPDARLRWLGGFNYYTQEFLTSSNGGVFVVACGNLGAFGTPAQCAAPARIPVDVDGGDFVDVRAFYGSLSYDITEQFTVDLEARWQDDTRSDGRGDFEINFKDFLPRISLRYRITEDITAYITTSRGILPGVINSNIINCNPTTYTQPFIDPRTGQPSTSSMCQQYVDALGADAVEVTPVQELDAYEIGVKSTWMDGRLVANVAAYWQEWANAPFPTFVTVYRDDDGDTIPNPNPNFNPVSTPGSSEYSGVELEVDFLISEDWDLSFNWSFNDNEYTEFLIPLASAEYALGTRNVKGHRSSRFPKWSGNVSSTYGGTFQNGWDWSLRGDLTYMGETFPGLTNLATLESYSLLNLRFAVERNDLRVEGYVKNALDEDYWRTGQEYTDFSRVLSVGFNFNRLGLTLVPQDRRTFGVRVAYEF
ncbi:MAG: TonB-dependent receptor [Gammaproteobacteria bacterium]|nr:TonB-dependent receptor [Gammaproteobacteria bacterium]